MKFRHWWQEFALAGLAGLSVLVSGALIVSSLRLHMTDMKWQLQKSEFLDGNTTKMYLVAHFVDQYELYQDKLSRREADEREFRLNTLFNTTHQGAWQALSAQDKLDWISRQIVNALRRFTGKLPLVDESEMHTFEGLEHAFQLERLHEYHAAIKVFTGLLTQSHDPRLRGIIELHLGFCSTLLSDMASARAWYESVIRSHSRDDLGITATLLLRHLEILVQEREVVAHAGLNDLERARKMTSLLQCKEVLGSFDPAAIANPQTRAEVLLLRARCEEEVGEPERAVQAYTETIRLAGPGELARDANRRLYMMGSFLKSGDKLQSIAHALNQSLRDEGLQHMEDFTKDLGQAPSRPNEAERGPEPDDSTLRMLERTAQALAPASSSSSRLEPSHALSSNHPNQNSDPILSSLPPIGTRVRIALQDGKTFVGRILSGPNEKPIRIQAMIGEIQIDPKQIESIEPQ